MTDTSISVTVDRSGVLDLLARTGHALHIAAVFMKSTDNMGDSVTVELCSSYVEALAAALENNLEETLARQLIPLVVALAQASGEEEIEEKTKVLEAQVAEMIKLIREGKEKGQAPFVLVADNGTVH